MNTRRVERLNPEGLTLGQIADWVSDCRAQGIPDAMAVDARVSLRGKLRSIAAECGVSPVSPLPVKSVVTPVPPGRTTFAKGGVIDPEGDAR